MNIFLYSFNSVVHTHYLEIFIKQIVIRNSSCISGRNTGHVKLLLYSFIWFLAFVSALQANRHANFRPGSKGELYLRGNVRSWLPRNDFGRIYHVTLIIQLQRVSAQSARNIVSPVFKTTKLSSVSLALPDKLYWIDLTVHMGIQRNPGPVSSETSAQLQPPLCKSNLPVLIKYLRTELLN